MNWCALALLANVGTDSMTKRAVRSSLFDAGETCVCTLVEFHYHHLELYLYFTLPCPSSGKSEY
jgi:hypothetical protein